MTRLAKPSAPNLKYDYVEVMACPSGCLNGGGQIKVESEMLKANIAAMQDKFLAAEVFFILEKLFLI